MAISNSLGEAALSQPIEIFESESSFCREFNQTSFLFSHNLAGNPLFSLPRLAELAKTLLADGRSRNVRWQISDVPVDAKWNAPLYKQQEKLTEAIANLEKSGSWVLLYSVQRDPEYRALLDQVMGDIETITSLERDQITWQDAYIFMASPASVTPYHIDHEATFLFQVHGDRQANIWNADDRSVLSEVEIERYYMGDLGAANYKPESQNKANVYALSAGKGVHHPTRAPHWFKNGSAYSVALGVHFCLRDCDRQVPVYQINYCLRQFGLNPTPPGQSIWRDQVKRSVVNLFAKRVPKSKDELLRSGIRRLTYPLDLVRKRNLRD